MFRKNSGIENFQAKEGEASFALKNFLWIKGGGYHDFPSKSFCLTVPKYFIGEHFGVSEKFFYRKFFCINFHHGFCQNFLSQDRNGKLCKGTLLFSRKFLVSKKNLWMRGGISRFSVEIFVSHSAEKFCKGILLFLRKFLVSKSFMDEKWGGGGVSRFSVEIFCLTVPKNFAGIPSMFQKIWGIEKFYA